MIDTVSLTKEWLDAKQKEHKRDPSIIESMIHALYLLEQLKLTGLDFIFKGGTSLVILLERPARFSVDIDVIINPSLTQEQLEEYLNNLVASTNAFIRVELDERRSYKPGVPKAHYKFIFNSNAAGVTKEGQPNPNPEREILLDVLFAENPYPNLVKRAINTNWLKLKSEPLVVKMPCVNSITGDKLTAFAPNTTGVPYYRLFVNKDGVIVSTEMFREIMKQLFDVGSLFDAMDEIELFRKSYHETVEAEIKYRSDRGVESREHVLKDTIATALILARREKQINDKDKQNFEDLKKGLESFGHYVFLGNFRIEHAQVAGAKAAYLSAILLTDYKGELNRFDEKTPLTNYLITHPDYHFLNKALKAVNRGEALFYWNEAVKLLQPE
jgi:hypothetical protein